MLAKIIRMYKKEVVIQIDSFKTAQSESPLLVELGQRISHGDKMDWINQKAIALGVNHIVRFITEKLKAMTTFPLGRRDKDN